MCNIDRRITESEHGKGILECKTIAGYTDGQYKTAVPYHKDQVMTYLYGTDESMGQLATLVDGRELKIWTVFTDDAYFSNINKLCLDFYLRMLEGLKIMHDKGLNSDQKFQTIFDLVPEETASKDYNDFLSDRFKLREEKTTVKYYIPEIELAAKDYLVALEDEKAAAKRKLEIRATLLKESVRSESDIYIGEEVQVTVEPFRVRRLGKA
jgi:hypothetical protein